MSDKSLIYQYFESQKEQFRIYAPVDKGISRFINKINKYKDIVTMHSCEGHEEEVESDCFCAYVSFNVSERMWFVFWSVFIPRLISDSNWKRDFEIRIFTYRYPAIAIYCHNPEHKEIFWMIFRKYLIRFLNEYSERN